MEKESWVNCVGTMFMCSFESNVGWSNASVGFRTCSLERQWTLDDGVPDHWTGFKTVYL